MYKEIDMMALYHNKYKEKLSRAIDELNKKIDESVDIVTRKHMTAEIKTTLGLDVIVDTLNNDWDTKIILDNRNETNTKLMLILENLDIKIEIEKVELDLLPESYITSLSYILKIKHKKDRHVALFEVGNLELDELNRERIQYILRNNPKKFPKIFNFDLNMIKEEIELYLGKEVYLADVTYSRDFFVFNSETHKTMYVIHVDQKNNSATISTVLEGEDHEYSI